MDGLCLKNAFLHYLHGLTLACKAHRTEQKPQTSNLMHLQSSILRSVLCYWCMGSVAGAYFMCIGSVTGTYYKPVVQHTTSHVTSWAGSPSSASGRLRMEVGQQRHLSKLTFDQLLKEAKSPWTRTHRSRRGLQGQFQITRVSPSSNPSGLTTVFLIIW